MANENGALGALNEAEGLIFGSDSIINSRYSSNERDFGLYLKQTLSFKKNEAAHKYYFTPYNLKRILDRMNLAENERTITDLTRDLHKFIGSDLELDNLSSDFVPIPKALSTDLGTIKQNSISGILDDIGYVYVTVDSKLYIYNYLFDQSRQTHTMFSFDKEDVIVSLCFLQQKTAKSLNNLLFVATPFKVYVLKIERQEGGVRICHFKDPLCCSTNGLLITSMTAVKDGRVFLGGSDGILYQLNYSIKGFRKNSTLVAKLFSDLLPGGNFCSLSSTSMLKSISSFVLPAVFNQPVLKKLLCDNKRNFLYLLFEDSSIASYALTKKKNVKKISFSTETVNNNGENRKEKPIIQLHKVISNISKEVTKYLQNPLHSVHMCGILAQDVAKNLDVVDFVVIENSELVCLMLVSKEGVRIYLSTDFKVFHVRGPPGTMSPIGTDFDLGVKPASKLDDKLSVLSCSTSSADGQSFLVVEDSKKQSFIVSFKPEYMSRQLYDKRNKVLEVLPGEQTFHEKFEYYNIEHFVELGHDYTVKAIKYVTLEVDNNIFNKAYKSETKVLMNISNLHKVLILTTKGLLVLTKRFPLHHLNSILLMERHNTIPLLKPVLIEDFFYNYGLLRASTMYISSLTTDKYVAAPRLQELLGNFFTFGFMNNLLPRWKPSHNIQLSNAVIAKPENLDFSGCFLGFLRIIDIVLSGFWTDNIFKSTSNSTLKASYLVFKHNEGILREAISKLNGLMKVAPYYKAHYDQLITASEISDPLYAQLCRKEKDLFSKSVLFVDRLLQGMTFIQVIVAKYSNLILGGIDKQYHTLTFKDLVCTVKGILFADSVINILGSSNVSDFVDFALCPHFLSENKLQTLNIINIVAGLKGLSQQDGINAKNRIRTILDRKYSLSSEIRSTATDKLADKERVYFLRKAQISQLLKLFVKEVVLTLDIYQDILLFCVKMSLLFIPEEEDLYTNDCLVLVFKALVELCKKFNVDIAIIVNSLLETISDQRFTEFVFNFFFDDISLRPVLGVLESSAVTAWYNKKIASSSDSIIAEKEALARNLLNQHKSIKAGILYREVALEESTSSGIKDSEPLSFSDRVKFMENALLALKSGASQAIESGAQENTSQMIIQVESELKLLDIQRTIIKKLYLLNTASSNEVISQISHKPLPISDLYNTCVHKFDLFEEGIGLMVISGIVDHEELRFLYSAAIDNLILGKSATDVLDTVQRLKQQFYLAGYFPTKQIVEQLEDTNSFSASGRYDVILAFLSSSIVPHDLFEVYLALAKSCITLDVMIDFLAKLVYGVQTAVDRGYIVGQANPSLELVPSSTGDKELKIHGISGIGKGQVLRILKEIKDHLQKVDSTNWEDPKLAVEKNSILQGIERVITKI